MLVAQGKDGGVQRSLLCLACIAGGAGQSWGGGESNACFACVALLALIHLCGVLWVVHWQGNRRHY
jgi:hypothetical protein